MEMAKISTFVRIKLVCEIFLYLKLHENGSKRHFFFLIEELYDFYSMFYKGSVL